MLSTIAVDGYTASSKINLTRSYPLKCYPWWWALTREVRDVDVVDDPCHCPCHYIIDSGRWSKLACWCCGHEIIDAGTLQKWSPLWDRKALYWTIRVWQDAVNRRCHGALLERAILPSAGGLQCLQLPPAPRGWSFFTSITSSTVKSSISSAGLHQQLVPPQCLVKLRAFSMLPNRMQKRFIFQFSCKICSMPYPCLLTSLALLQIGRGIFGVGVCKHCVVNCVCANACVCQRTHKTQSKKWRQ